MLTTQTRPRSDVIAALRHALPYLRLFSGKTFVVKAGGEVFETADGTRALLEQLGVLHLVGIRCVLVHGGGPQSTALAGKLGLQTRFVEGRRVTCEGTRDVATMALNGEVNTRIVAACRHLEIPAVGLSGVDAGLIQAQKRPPREVPGNGLVDYGFVGDVQAIDPAVIERILGGGFVPVLSPLAADAKGTVLNVNADVVAARVAAALDAEKLLLVTGAPGLLADPTDPASLVSYTDLAGLERLLAEGVIRDGMLPKVASIETALRGGVRRVHIVGHRVPDSLLLEVFTNEGSGTMVVRDVDELRQSAAG